MASSLLNSSNSGSSFNVSIPSKYTSVVLTQTYAAGAYSFTSANGASNMDVYFLNTSTGTTVGYTSTKAITASASFNKIVVLGGSTGDLLQFTFTTTYVASAETSETSAGPVLTGATPTTVANINNTLTVSGYNFASGMSVVFTGTDATPRTAKSVIVGSPTSAIVTRPDALPVSYNPYTLSAYNPGVNSPVGSNSYILATPTISAGSLPTWTTPAGSIGTFTQGTFSSYTLVATDSNPGGSITYAYVSGSLPSGLSFNASTGVISGTPTVATPGVYTYTVSATNSGGNSVNRTFTLQDTGPVWATTGALANATPNTAYSYTLSAPDDSGAAPTFALVSGSLPSGLSLSSSGVISGTPTISGTSTFVVSATDSNGTTTSSATLSIYVTTPQYSTITSTGNFTVPAGITSINFILVAGGGSGGSPNTNVGGGGAGAGGVRVVSSYSVTPGQVIAATIGAGGASIGANNGDGGYGNHGSNSSFGPYSATGGGAGGAWYLATSPNGGSGGSGAGSVAGSSYGIGNAGAYTPPEGYNGSPFGSQYIAGAGGGAGGAASGGTGGNGYTWIDGTVYAQGGNGTNNSGGGGGSRGGYGTGGNGSSGAASGAGNSGVVKVMWYG